MPRFVVLRHDWPTLHWDLMLENGAALRSWRLSRFPDCAGPIPVQRLPDHRLAYLDYEGPVSGNRGSVAQVLNGHFEVQRQDGGRLELSFTSRLGDWRAIVTGPAASEICRPQEDTGEIEFHSVPN